MTSIVDSIKYSIKDSIMDDKNQDQDIKIENMKEDNNVVQPRGQYNMSINEKVQGGNNLVPHNDHLDYVDGGDLFCSHNDEHNGSFYAYLQEEFLTSYTSLSKYNNIHSNNNTQNSKANFTKYYVMMGMIGVFFLVELIVGHVVGSLSLVADAFHMMSDFIALVIGYYASYKLVRNKKELKKHATFGLHRMEILGGLINGVFLLASCFHIVLEMIDRLMDMGEVEESLEDNDNIILLLVVGGIGLLINLIGLLLFSHGHSVNTRAVFLHVLGDAFGSVCVIVSSLIIYFFDFDERFYLDPILSGIIASIIVFSSTKLIKKTIYILLEEAPSTMNLDEIKKEVLKIPGINGIHKLHVWQLTTNRNIGMLHVVTNQNLMSNVLVSKIKKILHSSNIHYSSIQVEYDHNTDRCIEKECDEECETIRRRYLDNIGHSHGHGGQTHSNNHHSNGEHSGHSH